MSTRSERVQIGSVTVYRPGLRDSDTDATRWARRLVMDLKNSKPERIQRFATWMVTRSRRFFPTWFGPGVILVPAPGHAPRLEGDDQQSSTRDIARALAGAGSIRVSATPLLGFEPMSRITVVDDVIASGATLYACARRLAEAFPHTGIAAFAVVRTMNSVAQVEEPLAPVREGEGSIVLRPDDTTDRTP